MSQNSLFKKFLGFFNSGLHIITAGLLAVIIIGYSIGAQFFWHKNPQRKIACDFTNETTDATNELNTYISPLFSTIIGKILDSGSSDIRLQTAGQQIGTLNPIAGFDPIVPSSSQTDGDDLVYSSQKTAASDQPLGWEADLGVTTTDQVQDHGVRFSYKSSVPVEVDVNYRNSDATVTSSTVYAKLGKTTNWSEQIMHFSSYPPNTHPYITISSADIGSLQIKNVKIGILPTKQLKTGIVSIAFDDGWESVYTYGEPLFTKYGITTTQFVVSDYSLGKQPLNEYMTPVQLKKLQSQGHEIASHSYEHCSAVTQKDSLLKDSIKNSQSQFKTTFGNAPTLYGHPFGAYDNRVNNVLGTDFNYIRSSDQGLNSAYFDPHNIKVMPVLESTTTQEVKSWVQTAANQHVWLVSL